MEYQPAIFVVPQVLYKLAKKAKYSTLYNIYTSIKKIYEKIVQGGLEKYFNNNHLNMVVSKVTAHQQQGQSFNTILKIVARR